MNGTQFLNQTIVQCIFQANQKNITLQKANRIFRRDHIKVLDMFTLSEDIDLRERRIEEA